MKSITMNQRRPPSFPSPVFEFHFEQQQEPSFNFDFGECTMQQHFCYQIFFLQRSAWVILPKPRGPGWEMGIQFRYIYIYIYIEAKWGQESFFKFSFEVCKHLSIYVLIHSISFFSSQFSVPTEGIGKKDYRFLLVALLFAYLLRVCLFLCQFCERGSMCYRVKRCCSSKSSFEYFESNWNEKKSCGFWWFFDCILRIALVRGWAQQLAAESPGWQSVYFTFALGSQDTDVEWRNLFCFSNLKGTKIRASAMSKAIFA